MRRVIVPALLAIVMVASTSSNVSAFGLFDKFCNKGCDSGCAEPACGCEAACEPTCGCEAPACGYEADPCCDSGCGKKCGGGLLSKLFGKHRSRGCDSGCCAEPACGCETACAPACGIEVASCGGCDSCCSKPKGLGLFKKLFSKHRGHGCDSGCCAEPACGCEAACEPTCGCEAPSCGIEAAGCGGCSSCN